MAKESLTQQIKGHPGFLPFWKSGVKTEQKPDNNNAQASKQGGGKGEG